MGSVALFDGDQVLSQIIDLKPAENGSELTLEEEVVYDSSLISLSEPVSIRPNSNSTAIPEIVLREGHNKSESAWPQYSICLG